jgi:threonine-phosphate decarboxylase
MAEEIRDIHGGNIYKASRQYGICTENLLDFSANINPLGMPEGLKETLIDSLEGIGNYPDPECTELREGISRYLGVAAENIIIGNGASEVIFLLMEVLKPSRLLIPAPAFLEYAKAAGSFGIPVDYMELKEESDFVLDMEELISTMDRGYDAVLLCNPNNPTSRLLKGKDLTRLLEAAAKKRTTIIIDEAFIELTVGGNTNSAVGFLEKYKNLFIIRALTKVFAIPGLRLGYGLGDCRLLEAMWKRKMPWSVNSLACSVGGILPKCGNFFQKTEVWLKEEKEWFFRELSLISGLKIYPPDTNFILARLTGEGWTAEKLREAMAAKGILIRNAANFQFLDKRYIRLAVKDRESNSKCLQALRNVLIL